MAIQKSHCKLYPLVSPADELPAGVPEQPEPIARRRNGTVASAEAAKRLGKRGGLARARRRADATAWGATMGLGRLLTLTEDSHLAPFVAEGEEWLAAQCVAVARDVGGGELSPGVVSILRGASWSRLFSSYLFDCGTRQSFAWQVDEERTPKVLPRTELLLVAQRLADSSRQALLAAHELSAREAKGRPRAADALPPGFEWHEDEGSST